MKIIYSKIILLTLLLASCGEHDKSNIKLIGFKDTNEIVFENNVAKFYFSRNDIQEYCKEMDNGEKNDFMYKQVLQYINDSNTNSIIIADTLATKMEKSSIVGINSNDSLVRIRNSESPYSHVAEVLSWAVIEFAEKGKLKVFDKRANSFVDNIVVDEVNTSGYGSTNILLTNDSIIFSRLIWIK